MPIKRHPTMKTKKSKKKKKTWPPGRKRKGDGLVVTVLSDGRFFTARRSKDEFGEPEAKGRFEAALRGARQAVVGKESKKKKPSPKT